MFPVDWHAMDNGTLDRLWRRCREGAGHCSHPRLCWAVLAQLPCAGRGSHILHFTRVDAFGKLSEVSALFRTLLTLMNSRYITKINSNFGTRCNFIWMSCVSKRSHLNMMHGASVRMGTLAWKPCQQFQNETACFRTVANTINVPWIVPMMFHLHGSNSASIGSLRIVRPHDVAAIRACETPIAESSHNGGCAFAPIGRLGTAAEGTGGEILAE